MNTCKVTFFTYGYGYLTAHARTWGRPRLGGRPARWRGF